MATKRPVGARNEMIHCEFCGEDYAATYKRCPFCEGRPVSEGESDENGEERRSGRRLVTNKRGGGYGGGPSPVRIAGTLLSLGLIVAAVCIVVSIIKPWIDNGNTPPIDPDTTPSQNVPVSSQPSTADPNATPAVSIPPDQTATGLTLNKSDFTLNDKYPDPVQLKATLIPAGSVGTVTWTSSDPEVAVVDENGRVSRGSKNGSATITASLPGGIEQKCLVRCNFSGSASSAGGSGTSTANLSLNKTDFTFSRVDEPSVQMRVNGTSSTPVWSIGNSSVATISSDGVVKPVGRGTTTITCTVDGQTLTCIVRCKF